MMKSLIHREIELIFVHSHFQLSCEIKHLLSLVSSINRVVRPEIAIVDGQIKRYEEENEPMYVEDLAALDRVTEDKVIEVLKKRMAIGESYSFIGDILLSLNSNELPKEYSRSVSTIRRHFPN